MWRHVVASQPLIVGVRFVASEGTISAEVRISANNDDVAKFVAPRGVHTSRVYSGTIPAEFHGRWKSKFDCDAFLYTIADLGAFEPRSARFSSCPIDDVLALLLNTMVDGTKKVDSWKLSVIDFVYIDSLTARIMRLNDVAADLARFCITKRGKINAKKMVRLPRTYIVNQKLVKRADENGWAQAIVGSLPVEPPPRFLASLSTAAPSTVRNFVEKSSVFLTACLRTMQVADIAELTKFSAVVTDALAIISGLTDVVAPAVEHAKLHNIRLVSEEYNARLKEVGVSKYFVAELDGIPIGADDVLKRPLILQRLEKTSASSTMTAPAGGKPTTNNSAIYQSYAKKHWVTDRRMIQYSDLNTQPYYDGALRLHELLKPIMMDLENVIIMLDVAAALTTYAVARKLIIFPLGDADDGHTRLSLGGAHPFDALPVPRTPNQLTFARRYDPLHTPEAPSHVPFNVEMRRGSRYRLDDASGCTGKTTMGVSIALIVALVNAGIPVAVERGHVPRVHSIMIARRPYDDDVDPIMKHLRLSTSERHMADIQRAERLSETQPSFHFLDDTVADMTPERFTQLTRENGIYSHELNSASLSIFVQCPRDVARMTPEDRGKGKDQEDTATWLIHATHSRDARMNLAIDLDVFPETPTTTSSWRDEDLDDDDDDDEGDGDDDDGDEV